MINLRRALVFFVLVSIAGYSLFSMPMLYHDIGPVARPCTDSTIIYLHGLALFVGDLHTSGQGSDSERFRELAGYVKAESVSHVVILGDLFSWRSDYDSLVSQSGGQKEAIRQVLDVLGLLGQPLSVYLVLGDRSHDPEDLNLSLEFGETKFMSVGKCAVFRMKGLTIIGLHGDQAFGGPFGFAVSIITRNLLLERSWKERMGIHADTWVIMGHTHLPGIDYTARVANTGGWVELPLATPTARGISVNEQGEINLIAFHSLSARG